MDVQARFIKFHYCILLSPFPDKNIQLSHSDSALRIFLQSPDRHAQWKRCGLHKCIKL